MDVFIGFIGIGIIFYLLPFIIAVILPAWLIPLLVKNKIIGKKNSFPSLLPFTLILILLAIVANFVWENQLFNKIYYEWDRLWLPYTFFHHERPLLDGTGSWIAPGWKLWHLDVIWIATTLGIYVLSAWFWLLINIKNWRKYFKFISISVIALIITSAIFYFVFPFISFLILTFHI